ncbi:retrotransposon protein, putative, ty1-copia subclass [Tanacetum coccineum]
MEKTVGSKWLFKKKTDMDGAVHTFKARLVAKGYTQTPGIDYEETFSPVADIRAIRILIAIAAYYDYEIWQMDVKYCLTSMVISRKWFSWRNLKVLSARNIQTETWFSVINVHDHVLYQKLRGSNVTSNLYCRTSILIRGLMISNVTRCYNPTLGKCFAMKDLGEAAYILGIKIYRDRSRRLIGLCQSAYIDKILKRFHMENSKRGSIPMQDKLRLSKSQGALNCCA